MTSGSPEVPFDSAPAAPFLENNALAAANRTAPPIAANRRAYCDLVIAPSISRTRDARSANLRVHALAFSRSTLPWITVRDVEAASGLPQMAPTLLINGRHPSPTLAGRHRLRAGYQRLLRSRAFVTWNAVAAA
jgi:hypothetical protein